MTTNIADAFDLVGKRWALQVVRELALGPQRYTDLRRRLVGISTNVLAARLYELQGGRGRSPATPATAGRFGGLRTDRARPRARSDRARPRRVGHTNTGNRHTRADPSWPERTEVEPCRRPIAHRSTASLRQPRGRAPRGVGGNADGPSRTCQPLRQRESRRNRPRGLGRGASESTTGG